MRRGGKEVRRNFQRIPSLDATHNEVHRRAYDTPYLCRVTSTLPTTETVEEGEIVLYDDESSVRRIYTKMNSTLRYVALT